MHSFRKNERLTKRSDFDSFRSVSSKFENKAFRFLWKRGEKRRIGIIVSGRVAKAVKRNQIKRVVRECFRGAKEKIPLGDLLVIAKPHCGSLEPNDLRTLFFEGAVRIRTREH